MTNYQVHHNALSSDTISSQENRDVNESFLQENISQHGFKLTPVAGDGNCMLHSILDNLCKISLHDSSLKNHLTGLGLSKDENYNITVSEETTLLLRLLMVNG